MQGARLDVQAKAGFLFVLSVAPIAVILKDRAYISNEIDGGKRQGLLGLQGSLAKARVRIPDCKEYDRQRCETCETVVNRC